jgi:hypothetical protein
LDGELVGELNVLPPPKHHLHEIRSLRIKRKSDYGVEGGVGSAQAQTQGTRGLQEYKKGNAVPWRLGVRHQRW